MFTRLFILLLIVASFGVASVGADDDVDTLPSVEETPLDEEPIAEGEPEEQQPLQQI